MKINTIIHDKPKERKNDLNKNSYNKNPKYHPFIQQREYIRAVNATKLDRLHSKPFIKAYNYHLEGITHLAQDKEADIFASASFDRSVYIWNIKEDDKQKIQLENRISGLSFLQNILLVCQSKSVFLFSYEDEVKKINEYESEFINSISANKTDFLISTTKGIKIFDLERKLPKYELGNENCHFVEQNPLLENLVAYAEGSLLNLVDTRINESFSNLNLGLKTNDIKFSKDGKFMASANEDASLFVHDLRYLDKPFVTFKHHLSAVNCIDFSKRITSGSADKTIRIFDLDEKRCLDVYHTRRMHNVNGIKFSKSEEFIISGSDDGSLRIWKTNASRKIGPMNDNQSKALAYNEALKNKFKFVNEVKRINNQRFLPKPLKQQIKINKEKKEAEERRKNKNK